MVSEASRSMGAVAIAAPAGRLTDAQVDEAGQAVLHAAKEVRDLMPSRLVTRAIDGRHTARQNSFLLWLVLLILRLRGR